MNRLRFHVRPGVWSSIALHTLGLVLVLLALRHTRGILSPLRMAGTRQGKHIMLTYSLGGPAEVKQSAPLQSSVRQPVTRGRSLTQQRSPQTLTSPKSSEPGAGSGGSSALGDEDVHVALPRTHPRPQPDLSLLPSGTTGDVVVDVVIDEAGKVTAATLVRGLGAPVDASVVEVLRGWTFTPATRNGQNIASEQEILIHYERG